MIVVPAAVSACLRSCHRLMQLQLHRQDTSVPHRNVLETIREERALVLLCTIVTAGPHRHARQLTIRVVTVPIS